MRKFTFGSRELNKLLDDTLMEKYGFASETLMELAGVAVAQVAHRLLRGVREKTGQKVEEQSICVLVGPGNNGGDGLVAARHLKMMRYPVDLIVFKELQGKNGNYLNLCKLNDIACLMPCDFEGESKDIKMKFNQHLQGKSLIIDSIFGFPFTGQVRQPYRDFIEQLKPSQSKILSVDVPSGWDANEGNIHNLFTPAYLISLGLPKKCSEGFLGEHFFGGRFVPEGVCKELGIVVPEFEEDALYCRL